MTTYSESKQCDFCGGDASYIYSMDDYPIFQCASCATGFVNPMPDGKILEAMYDGFIPHIKTDMYPRYKTAAQGLFARLHLPVGQNLSMLDIGGGGGFFCKAFEDCGYGEGTYVDLDPQSCRFAHDLGITNVHNCDAMQLDTQISHKFDFIHCRHLIEHMIDPTGFLKKIHGLLRTGGIFLLQCPNGDSLEYLVYTHLNIKYRFDKIRKSNNFSSLQTMRLFLTGSILHGIDPSRHLWAISREGMRIWAQRNNIPCRIFTAHLGDPVFSPGFRKKAGLKGKIKDFIGCQILSRIHGGTHLIAILRAGETAG